MFLQSTVFFLGVVVALPKPAHVTPAPPAANHPAKHPQPQNAKSVFELDSLAIYGFLSLVMIVFFYSQERHARICSLGCAAACLMAASYGFVQGAWPLGVAEGLWAIAAFRRWRARGSTRPSPSRSKYALAYIADSELRLTRMFDEN